MGAVPALRDHVRQQPSHVSAPGMDRLAPSLRPDERVVMYQRWRKLLFLHWELPAQELARALPPGLSLDTYEGRAFIGLVPFTMRGVRPALLPPFPPLSNFHETNVRTYVHLNGKDPGVFFFSLDAANGIAVRLARAWYKLPYFYSRMSLMDDAASGWRSYRSERRWPAPVPATFAVRGLPEGAAAVSSPGTLQHFLMERYFLYTAHGGGAPSRPGAPRALPGAERARGGAGGVPAGGGGLAPSGQRPTGARLGRGGCRGVRAQARLRFPGRALRSLIRAGSPPRNRGPGGTSPRCA
ncbi:conserved protein YqjF [Stigmatella aurantiaca DW4/3-1]|uniref:Conserved protein YqjF n=1 Tax=Stigmatella aurantiaca (strain DW4/3-1) TaxID=378806 RepID=Q08ZR3_STIAD|nr:conserved protein YqjF [Stigmatella aurantiaca DW4/3-1]